MNNNYYQTSTYISRDGNVPGYIYIMEAQGYNGIIPGLFIKRIKIGLSRNPNAREWQLNGQQAPCNINLIKSIYVYSMEEAENYLHKEFRSCHVQLRR
ncbi:MAG: GIY-YIG nuclease family protein [Calothrix sp. MO_167.B12]|nr:GIY-YIG nuclease family protein [Calothrix sp. MO_167.B12]